MENHGTILIYTWAKSRAYTEVNSDKAVIYKFCYKVSVLDYL